jgi:two-component system, chemotaxis family, chemotaxis protein CheY
MKLKCVLVEDTLFMREVYKFNLRNEQIDIVGEAADGMEALIQINQHKPDLIILDLVLPIKNGFDVLKEVTHMSPKSRCLVISSMDDEETKSKALALGAIQYITKPFTKLQLLQAIQEISQNFSEAANG